MKKIFSYPEEPIPPFEGAHPPHGYGGHASRNWGQFTTLTIHEIVALSFGMNPLTTEAFWQDRGLWGTLHIGLWNSLLAEVGRAVQAGIIRRADSDTSKDITNDTPVSASDAEAYFQNKAEENTRKSKQKRRSKKCVHLIRLVTNKIASGMNYGEFAKEMIDSYLHNGKGKPDNNLTFTFDDNLCNIYLTPRPDKKYTFHYSIPDAKGSLKSKKTSLISIRRYFLESKIP